MKSKELKRKEAAERLVARLKHCLEEYVDKKTLFYIIEGDKVIKQINILKAKGVPVEDVSKLEKQVIMYSANSEKEKK